MNDINSERAGPSASLTWYGQAGFRLAAGDSRVLVDPFLTGRPDRRYEPPAAAAGFARGPPGPGSPRPRAPPGPAVPAGFLRGQLRGPGRGAPAGGRGRGRGRDR